MLHDITSLNGRKKVRKGRGGNKGVTCGRGHKGQKSRAGRKIRPSLRDIMQSIPKRRGYGSKRSRGIISGKIKHESVNVSLFEKYFNQGDTIRPQILVRNKLVRKAKGSKPVIKILGHGDIKKSVNLVGFKASELARKKIVEAGGRVL